jgi:hypothetical protein
VTRQRLRPAYTPEQLAEIYAKPHSSGRWHDHRVRVEITVDLYAGLVDSDATIDSVADLSCGDARVAHSVQRRRVVLGDFAPGYDHTGPVERTIDEIDPVDVFICCETLEHLDDPDLVLKKIRQKARYLVLSTPIEAWGETNPEHYWAWDRGGVEAMLHLAGFTTFKPYVELDMRDSWSPYCFGIWVAS